LFTIAYPQLRTAIAAVPQEPFFLTGSVRANANPLKEGKENEDEIWRALEKTSLAKLIKDKGGLDTELSVDWLSTSQ
jgi:ATP-binding cassette subfamily C (CFTR/MRP) protein 1